MKKLVIIVLYFLLLPSFAFAINGIKGFEYDNEGRFTIENVNTPRTIDRTNAVIVVDTTVVNTVTPTTIYTGVIAADALLAGNVLKVFVSGHLSNATAADDITITGYLGTVSLGSFNPAIGNVADANWHIEAVITIRTIEVGGTCAWHAHMEISGTDTRGSASVALDTTTTNDFTIVVVWDNAKAGNTITAHQGIIEFKN